MEVVKTSEELEKQILEDARKKAGKILESAEKECIEIRREGERRVAEECTVMTEATDRKIQGLQHELSASLPLDFMRKRLTFIEESLTGALQEYLDGLDAAALKEVLAVQIARARNVLRDCEVQVLAGGIPLKEASALVQEAIPGIRIGNVTGMEEKGIVLETVDKKIRFRATIAEIRQLLLEDHREELADALLGKDI